MLQSKILFDIPFLAKMCFHKVKAWAKTRMAILMYSLKNQM